MNCHCIECGLDHCEPMELCEYGCDGHVVEPERAAEDDGDRAQDLADQISDEAYDAWRVEQLDAIGRMG